MVENEKLRKQVKSAFQLRAISLKRDTLDYATKILSGFDAAKRTEWIERILDALAKQNVSKPLLDLETFQAAVAFCSVKKSDASETLFNVIDVFSAPRIKYDETCNKIILVPQEASAISKPDDVCEMFRNRLKLVLQRVQRSSAFEHFCLNSVEKLLGSARKVDGVIVLGMFSQRDAETYQIEDLTGSIPVDLSKATFHSGLFTDGSIVLLEGNYCNGLLEVSGVGLAPIESASITRSHFGNENWFGGESSVAYRSVTRLEKANALNVDARIVFVSDAWLNSPKVMSGIYKMLLGFSESPPVAFVFCGNFGSAPGTPSAFHELKDGFRHFANIVSEMIEEHEALKTCNFVFVPGPEDPSLTTVLPRPPLPYSLFEELRKVPNCSFASNPCRIQYANQEIVVFRQDIIEKMCRNSIHMPAKTCDIAEQLCKTIASVGHLCPLPLHVSPVYSQMDHALILYPLPDLVILADQFQQFVIPQHGCHFANPGSFARSELDFLVYYPSSNEIERSNINV